MCCIEGADVSRHDGSNIEFAGVCLDVTPCLDSPEHQRSTSMMCMCQSIRGPSRASRAVATLRPTSRNSVGCDPRPDCGGDMEAGLENRRRTEEAGPYGHRYRRSPPSRTAIGPPRSPLPALCNHRVILQGNIRSPPYFDFAGRSALCRGGSWPLTTPRSTCDGRLFRRVPTA